MLRPWLPTCMTQPMITSSISAGSRSLRSASARSTSPARSAGCQPDSFPLRLPPAVRTASTITAVAMVVLLRDLDLTGRSSLASGRTGSQPELIRPEWSWAPTDGEAAWGQITREQLDEAAAGQTVPSRFVGTVADHPDQVALAGKDGDGWDEWTYAEYADRVAGVTTALEGLGIGPGDRIVLMMRNILDFHVIDMAALFRGATPISIYNSSPPEQIAYLAGHCKAKLAIVEDVGFLERFAQGPRRAPRAQNDRCCRSRRAGRRRHASTAPRCSRPRPRRPRGGHGELHARLARHGHLHVGHHRPAQGRDAHAPQHRVDRRGLPAPPRRRARRASAPSPTCRWPTSPSACPPTTWPPSGGYEVTTCPDPGQIAAYAREVHPQIMFGVPRVWEKIHAGVQAALGADPEKKRQFDEAVAAATPIVERRTEGDGHGGRAGHAGRSSTTPRSAASAALSASTRSSSRSPARPRSRPS